MKNVERNINPLRWREGFALLSVFLIWGSTFFAIKIGIEGFPPFLMAGVRFVVAGCVLYAFLRLRGAQSPSTKEWMNSALMGTLLLFFGNGFLTRAEKTVPSGLACLVNGTIPLWSAVFGRLFGRMPSSRELFGLGIGFAGVVMLNVGGDLWTHPSGAPLILVAAVSWAFGVAISSRLTLPQGAMASATQMMTGGTVLLLASGLCGEHLVAMPRKSAILALAYLIVFGSLIAYSAFTFVLSRVPVSVATSYAYVNPVVAVFLGWRFLGESITPLMLVSGVAILIGVALMTLQPASVKAKVEILSDELILEKEEAVA